MSVRVTATTKTGTRAYLVDLGRVAYKEAHRFQLACVHYRHSADDSIDVFIVAEHFPVFTLGVRGGLTSLKVSEQQLAVHGVELVQTERGGDITYHGPGQLVVYPIINLRSSRLSIKQYVDLLEEVMLATVSDFGVSAVRDQRNRGIWVGNNKVGSIGIRVRHGITFHGLALNVSPDFRHFGWIKPCGLAGVGVSSLSKETGENILFEEVKDMMINHLARLFDKRLVPASATMISSEQYENR